MTSSVAGSTPIVAALFRYCLHSRNPMHRHEYSSLQHVHYISRGRKVRGYRSKSTKMFWTTIVEVQSQSKVVLQEGTNLRREKRTSRQLLVMREFRPNYLPSPDRVQCLHSPSLTLHAVEPALYGCIAVLSCALIRTSSSTLACSPSSSSSSGTDSVPLPTSSISSS